MRLFDAHQHFWTIGGPGQSWPDADWPRIHRDFGPDDLRADVQGFDLIGTILVQSQPDDRDTDWMCRAVDDDPMVKGIVGWVDFERADAPQRIAELARRPRLVGLRPMLQGIDDIHLNDTSNYVRADFSQRLGSIFFIRLELFKRKFSVKFLNNLLMQLLSVLFYLIGGYFVVTGRLDLGSLVASIAAYKDLPTPVKGLIDWDQQRLMAQIRYAHAIEVFNRDDLMPTQLQAVDSKWKRIEKGFEFRNVGYYEPGAAARLESFTAQVAAVF